MMVTISLTPFRVAGVLGSVATALTADGWDAELRPLAAAIDRAVGFWPGRGSEPAEQTTLAAWDALADYLRAEPHEWERQAGRTQAEVVEACLGARARLNYLDTVACGYVTPLATGGRCPRCGRDFEGCRCTGVTA